MPIAASIANCDLAQMPAALRKTGLRAAQSIARVTGAIGCGSAIAAARQPIYAGRQLAMPHCQATFKIGCAEHSLALYSMHESAFRFARELRALLWLRAPGCCSVRFLFWRRPILSVIRWLLQRLLRLLSGLLPELLRLLGGVATIGLGGGIGITAGIMAGGAGTAGAAEVGGMAAADAAGMAADGAGMVTIDLKSSPATFLGYLAATNSCLCCSRLAARFFEQLRSDQQPNLPRRWSTRPSPRLTALKFL